MMAKAKIPTGEIFSKIEEELETTHHFSTRDLEKIDTFLAASKATGTLRIDYNLGGRTRARFVTVDPVEVD